MIRGKKQWCVLTGIMVHSITVRGPGVLRVQTADRRKARLKERVVKLYLFAWLHVRGCMLARGNEEEKGNFTITMGFECCEVGMMPNKIKSGPPVDMLWKDAFQRMVW